MQPSARDQDPAALVKVPPGSGRHPALVWAASGLMSLTGPEHGPPVPASGRWVERLDDVVQEIARLRGAPLRASAAGFLGERVALAGHRRQGSLSVGGACRMVAASDGVLAVSLPRTSDSEAVPAWLELHSAGTADVWSAVAAGARERTVAELVERAAWLGLAVGPATRPAPPAEPCSFVAAGPAASGRNLVLDLSSLWAGPLCASLLGGFGLEVLKVECPGRPDGARYGSPPFYELLNRDKREAVIDLGSESGHRRFLDLCRQSAVVVDGLRPRVWANWGIDRLRVARDCGLVWVSITAHGDNRAGFGDDAAVSGGLWLPDPAGGLPWFVADAAADPVAGLVACRAAASALVAGRAGMIEVAMSRAVSWVRAGDDLSVDGAEVFRRGDHWVVRAGDDEQEVTEPTGPA
ncbi:CoA transferase [Candidatus Poriferisocius sp.]|uniref:CoA transferase n=1 Tax=Candidatus Poriferisocius sp. TaxID=3101276 RepID=UPI003B02259B